MFRWFLIELPCAVRFATVVEPLETVLELQAGQSLRVYLTVV